MGLESSLSSQNDFELYVKRSPMGKCEENYLDGCLVNSSKEWYVVSLEGLHVGTLVGSSNAFFNEEGSQEKFH